MQTMHPFFPPHKAPVMRLTQLKSHCYTFPPDKSYFIKLKCKGISKPACFLHTIVYISNLIHTPKLPTLLKPLSWEFPSTAHRLPSVSSQLPFPSGAREGIKCVGACQNASLRLSFHGVWVTPACRRNAGPGS